MYSNTQFFIVVCIVRGHTVKYLHRYPKSRTFISKNIGLTWPSIFHTFDKDTVTKSSKSKALNILGVDMIFWNTKLRSHH